jgi:hypothetical protein
MAKQLHKRFPDKQVKSLLKRYLSKEIESSYILDILGIKRRRFSKLVKRYREDPENFSISYRREKRRMRRKDALKKNAYHLFF